MSAAPEIYTNSSGIAGKCQITLPYIRIVQSNASVTVAWPLWADPYQLQEAGKLLPASEWTNSSLTVTTNGSGLSRGFMKTWRPKQGME